MHGRRVTVSHLRSVLASLLARIGQTKRHRQIYDRQTERKKQTIDTDTQPDRQKCRQTDSLRQTQTV